MVHISILSVFYYFWILCPCKRVLGSQRVYMAELSVLFFDIRVSCFNFVLQVAVNFIDRIHFSIHE